MTNKAQLAAERLHELAQKANVDIKEVEKALGVSRYAFWSWRRGDSSATKAYVALMVRLIAVLEKMLKERTLPVQGPQRYSRLRGNALFKVIAEKL